jgi:hypothetical protein
MPTMTKGASTSKPAAATSCCCPACAGLQCLDRTRFFAGQLLTEADFNNEQAYWLAKSRLHNRLLHGWGVVCGLQVVCGECDGWVNIDPGYAIDPCGNDIIVCAPQSFNVNKAIQSCCTPARQSPNCSPPRYTPPPACQDAIQHWCITIKYDEQPTRLTTALQQSQAKAKTCSCGCGGHGQCGCNGTSKTQTSTAPAGACEATRIVEGFVLGVCEEPADCTSTSGTLRDRLQQCLAAVESLIQQAPDFSTVGNWTAQTAYQAACKYLLSVRNYLARASLAHCGVLDTVAGLSVPVIGPPQPLDQYLATLSGLVAQLRQLLLGTLFDCLCFGLLPPCPPDPCDNRLILACVTMQNGKILNVCNFGCRRQVVTFPSLFYWLSAFGFDKVFGQVTTFLENLCCNEGNRFSNGLSTGSREALSTAGFTNAGMINRALAAFVAQNVGATAVNAAGGEANAIDLRPLTGQSTESVAAALRQVAVKRVTTVAVDADPAWTDDAIAASAAMAPAAFYNTQPLTVYTRGGAVVGFDVTSLTDVLSQQIADLQSQVSALQQKLNAAPQ